MEDFFLGKAFLIGDPPTNSGNAKADSGTHYFEDPNILVLALLVADCFKTFLK